VTPAWSQLLQPPLTAFFAGFTFSIFRSGTVLSPSELTTLATEAVVAALVIGLLGSLVAVTAHEAGHAIAAWAVGTPAKSVRIGRGPAVAAFSIGRTAIHFHAIPVTGRTVHAYSPEITTRQRRLMIISGPLMHVVLILAAVPLLVSTGLVSTMAFGFIAINVELLKCNLRAHKPCGAELGNDGWQLQQLRRGGVELLRRHQLQQHGQAILRGEPTRAIEMLLEQLAGCADDKEPRRLTLQLHLGLQYGRAGQFEQAALVFVDVLARIDTNGSDAVLLRAAWADAVLSHAVISGFDPEPAVLQSCQRALQAVGEDTRGVTHSRALLALVSGQLSTAVELGQASLKADKPEEEERHLIAATISLALARLGDLPAARAWLTDVPATTPFAAAARAAAAAAI
jgi:hypothetical protein